MANWITGREVIVALGVAGTWRTAVSVNAASKGLLVTSESMGAKAPTFLEDDSLGKDDIDCLIRTHEKAEGSLSGYLRFQEYEVPLALVMGTATNPNLVGTLTYASTISLGSNIDGVFGTIAMKKSNTTDGIWEIPSAKFHGFTISGAVGELTTTEFRVMGNKIVTVAASVTNTSLASVTYEGDECGNIAKLDGNFYIRMNAQSGGALSSSDAYYPNQIEITYDRPFAEQYEAGYRDMSEPVQDGFATGTIRLTFDKYETDAFMDALDANGSNDFKVEVYFQSTNAIEGSKYYSYKLQMPHVKWTSASADVGGAGTIPHVVEGRFLQADSTPTGMQGTDPLYIVAQSKRTTNPLA